MTPQQDMVWFPAMHRGVVVFDVLLVSVNICVGCCMHCLSAVSLPARKYLASYIHYPASGNHHATSLAILYSWQCFDWQSEQ
jgi:hypothetical protein